MAIDSTVTFRIHMLNHVHPISWYYMLYSRIHNIYIIYGHTMIEYTYLIWSTQTGQGKRSPITIKQAKCIRNTSHTTTQSRTQSHKHNTTTTKSQEIIPQRDPGSNEARRDERRSLRRRRSANRNGARRASGRTGITGGICSGERGGCSASRLVARRAVSSLGERGGDDESGAQRTGAGAL